MVGWEISALQQGWKHQPDDVSRNQPAISPCDLAQHQVWLSTWGSRAPASWMHRTEAVSTKRCDPRDGSSKTARDLQHTRRIVRGLLFHLGLTHMCWRSLSILDLTMVMCSALGRDGKPPISTLEFQPGTGGEWLVWNSQQEEDWIYPPSILESILLI